MEILINLQHQLILKAISDIFSTFPITNNDELEIITNAIKEKEDSHDKLVTVYIFI